MLFIIAKLPHLSFIPDPPAGDESLVRPAVFPEHRPQVSVGNGQSNQRDYVGHQEENDLIYHLS